MSARRPKGAAAAGLVVTLVLVLIVEAAGDAAAESLPVEPLPPPPPAAAPRSNGWCASVDGLNKPVALTFAPGDPDAGGCSSASRRGRPGARVARRQVLDAQPFLDVRDRVSGATEQGLLGLACFIPDAGRTTAAFTSTTPIASATRASSSSIAPIGSASLLFVKQPFANHNGGDLVFGPDGKLYVGLGDGGLGQLIPSATVRIPRLLLGKMLRLDVDAPGRPAPAMVARGLRNPWRYALEPIARRRRPVHRRRRPGSLGRVSTSLPPGTAARRAATSSCRRSWRACTAAAAAACDPRWAGPCRCSSTTTRRDARSRAASSIAARKLPALDGAYFYADYFARRWCAAFAGRAGASATRGTGARRSIPRNAAGQHLEPRRGRRRRAVYLLSLDGVVWALAPRWAFSRALEQAQGPQRQPAEEEHARPSAMRRSL